MGKKRAREEDANCDHAMPISKRINRLHIENSPIIPVSPKQSSDDSSVILNCSGVNECQGLVAPTSNGQFREISSFDASASSHHFTSSTSGTSQPFQTPRSVAYNPELSREENPFYYSVNEQLFYLSVERNQRNNRQQQ